ncbi:MAG: hypothetical protein D6722_08960 [Bacteroidetes bacterium]|nr:MAG: hypothetical protein D6722_08960 [Bacteroidota bacterium]
MLAINAQVEAVNRRATGDQALRKDLRKAQANIFKLLEKELKVVPKNFYRNRWMALGMAVIGIPLGVAFGASLGSMAFLGVGIPIGMSIGMALGAGMDKKAAEEGGS